MASGSDLVKAAGSNRLEEVERLLQEGADINATDENGRTAISLGALHGHLDVVKALHKRNADIHIRDQNNWCPLDWARIMGQENVVSFFLAHEDASQKYFNGRGLIYVAAQSGTVEDVNRFVALQPGDVDRREEDGLTPLMAAVQNNRSDNVVALLKAGAYLFLKDDKQRTVFYWAAKKGHLEVMRVLTETYADPRKMMCDPPNDQAIVFAFAATANDKEWNAFLHARPDRPVKRDGERTTTALHFAVQHKLETAIERMVALEDSGLNAWNEADETPLINASIYGHVHLVDLLLRHHPDINLADNNRYNWTALMYAVMHGHDQIVERLCRERDHNDIDARDWSGCTALIMGAKKGYVASVGTLIKAGADVNVLDRLDGRSPLSWAAQDGNVEVVKALIEAGADLYTESRGRTPVWFAINCLEILQTFIHHRRENLADGAEQIPRVRMVELALRYSCAADESKSTNRIGDEAGPRVLSFLLDNKEYLEATDHDGRNLVSWAAQGGSCKEMEVLRGTKQFDLINAKDNNDRTPLHWATEGQNRDVVAWLLAAQVAVDPADSTGGTPLFSAAAKGHHEIMEMLLMAGASSNSHDRDERTAISWAAEGGHNECVRTLLRHGAHPDSTDKDRRTPLSLAAENGHADVVTLLLSLGEDEAKTDGGAAVRTETGRGGTGAKDGGTLVSVDSRDVEERTPLWYAVTGFHLAVFKILRANGADPGVKDRSGRALQQILVDKTAGDLEPQAVSALDAMLEQLRSAQALLFDPLGGGADVDEEFEATVLRIPENENLDLEVTMPPVHSLLRGNGLPDPQGASCSWIHLPANNMRWVEVLMSRHYETCGGSERWNSTVVLESKLWEQQQHRSRGRAQHARFMRPACHRFFLRGRSEMTSKSMDHKWKETEANRGWDASNDVQRPDEGRQTEGKDESQPQPQPSSSKPQGEEDPREGETGHRARDIKKADVPENRRTPSAGQGFVLFMPYLHWELQSQQSKMKVIMDMATDGRKATRERILADPALNDLKGTQKLYWVYLDEAHPLHVRRTLDQYYYHTLPDTEERDKDQTAIRYHNQHLKSTNLTPVLTMVDQLWMWVLPACGKSPPTIVTAFAQRYDRMLTGGAKHMTALVSNIIDQFRDTSERSVGGLAKVITAECSRIYFDSMSNRHESLQFSEIYTTSIGEITEREIRRFRAFQDHIHPAGDVKWRNPELESLLDIADDIKDLREIKNVRDELNIMSSVFHTQSGVMKAMEHMLWEQKDRRNDTTGWLRQTRSNFPHMAASLEDINGERVHHSPMLSVVDRNIREVERLDLFGERATRAIEQLLDLKNKQANLKLTQEIYKINDGTDRQGKTVMYFTVATIIFLPLSFMSSFLTIEVEEFPRGEGGKLSISFVVLVIFTVSVVLIIPSVFVAFNLDHDSRVRHKKWAKTFWDRWLGRLVDRGRDPKDGPTTMKTDVPDQGVTMEPTTGDENSIVAGKARSKWRISRRARPKQHDAESGGNVADKKSV